MNISLNKNDAMSGIIKLEIEKKDYESEVEKALRQYRQKANIPGFRKGMAPMGIIKKMYGKGVLVDKLDQIVSENLSKYIKENDIQIIGNPLTSDTEQKPIDFDTQEEFEFCYDVALLPDLEIKLDREDQLICYQVEIDDATLEQQIADCQNSCGSYEPVETSETSESTDIIKGVVTELENGNPKEDGITVQDAIVVPNHIDIEEEKNKFIGVKLDDVIIFNPYKACEGSIPDVAAFLNVDESVAESITGDFSFRVVEITRLKDAEVDQNLFDRIFGKGQVKSEEEFKEKIKNALLEQLKPKIHFKLMHDIRALLVRKTQEVTLADSILKRWMLASDKDTTPEKIEENYANTVESLKVYLAKEYLMKTHHLTVEEEDLTNAAKQIVQLQYARFGLFHIPDDTLDELAQDALEEEKTAQHAMDFAMNEKLISWIKSQVNVETKSISFEEFEEILLN